ncbi:urease accessory protein UreD [Pelomicrobium methylotrophicum]|uniref:Urease accessory protein UreD n=1 Tax=Pelomicrobium methylotrophicum TaxID=2602750 RepID=A0A5C7EK17_9PROT|nr:urease accessory protein UreD [Pelomicrobium methylotrophicum]TXF11694.1 urease accessory protein UreD [Pelomicrobium methylotrophicum]
MIPREQVAATGWHGALTLRYDRDGPRTRLVERAHSGPLAVQKPFYPEGEAVCHTVPLHPPAGLAGGDRLDLCVQLMSGAHALLTTPGANKWYRSAGPEAAQRLRFDVEDDATLEWLPQETIVFDQARAVMHCDVHLKERSRYIGWEILCLGRTARGERFSRGTVKLSTRLWRNGRPLWLEQGILAGGGPVLTSPAGLAGQPVCGTLLAIADHIPPELLERCRDVAPAQSCAGGITALPGLLVARFLGPSGQAARRYFGQLWALIRPALCGRAACPPRIWNT